MLLSLLVCISTVQGTRSSPTPEKIDFTIASVTLASRSQSLVEVMARPPLPPPPPYSLLLRGVYNLAHDDCFCCFFFFFLGGGGGGGAAVHHLAVCDWVVGLLVCSQARPSVTVTVQS